MARTPDGPPAIRVTPVGAPETVFDWRRDRCETIDTPDAAPRAFRDANGTVHLVASHYVTREMTGPSLDQIRSGCEVAYRSGLDRRYETHRNHEWLSSFYTIDGRTVFALIHNEYHGEADPARCPEEQSWRCWWNSLTEVVSTDQGNHFHRMAKDATVAALPWPYSNEEGRAAGYFTPSNIVAFEGAWYVVVKATAYHEQPAGSCLLRTVALDDPKAWRAWDGSRFSVPLGDPPDRSMRHPGAHVCTPIPNLSLGDVYGLARDQQSGAFVATMVAMLPVGASRSICGVWAIASYNLREWSQPVLVERDPASPATCEPVANVYPAILDPESTSANFETFGARPYLYFVRVDLDHAPYDRRLLRQRIRIEVRKAGDDP